MAILAWPKDFYLFKFSHVLFKGDILHFSLLLRNIPRSPKGNNCPKNQFIVNSFRDVAARGHTVAALQRRKLAHCPLRETKSEDSKESGMARPGESLNKPITIRSTAHTKLGRIEK